MDKHDHAKEGPDGATTEPERVATIRRMAALPGSGVRPDQVPAIAKAFESLISQQEAWT